MSAVERTVLNADVIERAIHRAVARLTTAVEQPDYDAELQQLDAALARLADAVASGGDVPALVVAMRERETQRQALVARRRTSTPVSTAPTPDVVMDDLRKRVDVPGDFRTS